MLSSILNFFQPPEKPHLKLLLIGKMGSGKTTCLNMMMNLVKKKTYEKERIIAIT
jgi:Flp pilus assembly CpaF family ATPase